MAGDTLQYAREDLLGLSRSLATLADQLVHDPGLDRVDRRDVAVDSLVHVLADLADVWEGDREALARGLQDLAQWVARAAAELDRADTELAARIHAVMGGAPTSAGAVA